MDGQNPAPTKPWNDDSLVNTSQQWFQFKVVQDFVRGRFAWRHSTYSPCFLCMTTGPLPKNTNWATLFQPWPRWSPLLPRAREQCHPLFRAYGPGNGIWDPISRPWPQVQEAGLPFGRCFKVEARVLGVGQLKGPSPPDVARLPILPLWFSVFPLSEAMCAWEMQGAFFSGYLACVFKEHDSGLAHMDRKSELLLLGGILKTTLESCFAHHAHPRE